jgi:hypothetical protein
MCFGGAEAEGAPSEAQLSNGIDKQLKVDEKKLNSVVKLLLLGTSPPSPCDPVENSINMASTGAGGSGKSTILRVSSLFWGHDVLTDPSKCGSFI